MPTISPATADRTTAAIRRPGGHAQNAFRVRCDCSYPLYIQGRRDVSQRRTCTSCRRVWDIQLESDNNRALMYNGDRRASQRGARTRARTTRARPRTAAARRTFGVEIELKGLTRARAVAALQSAGLAARDENYTHRRTAHWKVVYDQSISGTGCEVVSPPLEGEAGLAELKTALAALRDAGATVDRQCGLHVHIGAAAFSTAACVRAIERYARFEVAIESFLAPSRRSRRNNMCREIRPSLEAIRQCRNLTEVARRLGSRYVTVNAHAYARHGTVEFRQHHGTLNYAKVANWVALLFRLFEDGAAAEPHGDLPALMREVEAPRELHAFFAGRAASLAVSAGSM